MPGDDAALAETLQAIRHWQLAAAAVLLGGAAGSGAALAWYRVGDLVFHLWPVVVFGTVFGGLLAVWTWRPRREASAAMERHVHLWWALFAVPPVLLVLTFLGILAGAAAQTVLRGVP